MNTQPSNNSYSISYEILERLSEELLDNEGHINTEIEQGDVLVVFEGCYSVDGTCENDYYNGTGASYLTYASVSLDCQTFVYDQETEDYIKVANDYTDKEFEKYLLN
ncbi:MAG: hypothetical protein SNH73_01520 [Rikenellaceae bacterium]